MVSACDLPPARLVVVPDILRAFSGLMIGKSLDDDHADHIHEIGDSPCQHCLIKNLPTSAEFAMEDAQIVASAIEALAEIGDPTSIEALKKIESDDRVVTLDDDAEQNSWTIGQLAGEAIQMMSVDVE